MQLSSRRPPTDPHDVASAVRGAAAHLGHRPAVSLLTAAGRQEQSSVSVAQWAAKTAHWLAIEHLLGPGDRLGLVGPPGWVPAVAALGAWWAGCVVVVGAAAEEVDVVLAHATHVPDGHDEVVTWGWGFDGAPTEPGDREPFVHAVAPFPDQPPTPAAAGDLAALTDGARSWTQAELLAAWKGATGTLGVAPDLPAAAWLPAVAVRPLMTGRPTVVLAPGVDPGAASGDRVTAWLEDQPAS